MDLDAAVSACVHRLFSSWIEAASESIDYSKGLIYLSFVNSVLSCEFMSVSYWPLQNAKAYGIKDPQGPPKTRRASHPNQMLKQHRRSQQHLGNSNLENHRIPELQMLLMQLNLLKTIPPQPT